MAVEERWKCPICGDRPKTIKDALDHIIKEHCPEYKEKYRPTLGRIRDFTR